MSRYESLDGIGAEAFAMRIGEDRVAWISILLR
jgi:hypothetical protein